MKYLLLALLVLGVASTVQAQPESAYYGVALGNFDYDEKDLAGNSFVSDKVSSYRLMVGYQFMEHLSVEGGFGKTGTIRDTATVPVFPTGTVNLNISYEFRMLTIRLLGVLPFDNGVSLLGGLGYTDMKIDFELSDGVNSVSDDETSNEPGYYVGAQYDWDRVAVRLAYEKFDFDGDIDVTETSLSVFYKL
jgi:opacity protein-like surface antigen